MESICPEPVHRLTVHFPALLRVYRRPPQFKTVPMGARKRAKVLARHFSPKIDAMHFSPNRRRLLNGLGP